MAKNCLDRIVVLIDMDCFFCQVETKLRPEYAGKPLAVVQYNQWKLGGIIAVNYEAREHGVTRHMRGGEAKEKCPQIILASVPCLRGKADTTRYRTAGREVIDAINKHCSVIERASVDEAYIDITDIVEKRISSSSFSPKQLVSQLSNTFIVGYSEIGKNDEDERRKGTETWISNIFQDLEDTQAQKLAVAGVIVEEIRRSIFELTGYRCSAGIAQNKILAKLACGLHKPNRQTILPPVAVPALYSTLPVKKVRNLGGKFGDTVVESLNCNVMGDLLQYSLQYLQKRFDDKTGLWLYNIARGIDNEPVTTRLVSKSIGACKKFPGKQAIATLDVLRHWASELSAEVCERLEKDLEENERRATLLSVSFHYYQNRTIITQSRSSTLTSYKPDKMADRCVDIITKATQCPIAYFGISVGKFVPAKGSGNFLNFFKPHKVKDNVQISDEVDKDDEVSLVPIASKIVNTPSVATASISHTLKSKNDECKTQTSKACTDIKDNMTTSSTSKSKDSPTSRKVNRLISSLNQRQERVPPKNILSTQNDNESLNQEKFKGSFFMNAFSENKESTSNVRLNNSDSESGYDSKDSDESNVEKHTSDEYDSSKEELYIERDLHNIEEDEFLTRPLVRSKKQSSNNKKSYSGEHASPSTSKNFPREEQVCKSSSVRLQDIFPDLNNIDPSIVSFLPPDLQEEARQYMKSKSKSTSKIQETVTKGSKSKSTKPAAAKPKKKNNIYSFLIKESSSSTSKVPLERCLQCDQLIPITKLTEHTDFHIAQTLQLELNAAESSTSAVKRKIESDAYESPAKRRVELETSRPSSTARAMTTFFP